MKFYELNKKPQISIGEKFGSLTVTSQPYYIESLGNSKHRRQYFDCICDCGEKKEQVQGSRLKKGEALLYCSRKCPFYQHSFTNSIPDSEKKCRLGEVYNYLTITKEAFYHLFNNKGNRYKSVEVQCKCGKIKIYREDKVYNGSYKSCGCVWEHAKHKKRDWGHIYRSYGISKEDYEKLLIDQNYSCAICKNQDSQTSVTNWLFVDHCHQTGKIRGLLCNQCNCGIGAFKDDIDIIQNAIDYLNKQ